MKKSKRGDIVRCTRLMDSPHVENPTAMKHYPIYGVCVEDRERGAAVKWMGVEAPMTSVLFESQNDRYWIIPDSEIPEDLWPQVAAMRLLGEYT